MEQIGTYKQCYVYNDSHIDVCFEIGKSEINMEQYSKNAAHKTQKHRQVEKKTYTHNSTHEDRQTDKECG